MFSACAGRRTVRHISHWRDCNGVYNRRQTHIYSRAGEELMHSGHGSSEMPVWGPIFSRVTNDVDLGRVRIDNLSRYLRDIQVME